MRLRASRNTGSTDWSCFCFFDVLWSLDMAIVSFSWFQGLSRSPSSKRVLYESALLAAMVDCATS